MTATSLAKRATVARKQRLSSAQRILLEHIILLGAALSLGILKQAWPVSLLATVGVTIATVWRLLAHRTARVVAMRSLEPLLIVVLSITYVVLLETTYQVSWGVRSGILALAMIWQVQFLLLQFDPTQSKPQSLHSLLLATLLQTIAGLWLLSRPDLLWLALPIVWISQYIVAHFWLERLGFHNSFVPAVWALVMVELTWLSSFAITFYSPIADWSVLITRMSLIALVIAYGWGSMLKLHSQRLLSRRLVLEYVMMCLVVLIALFVLPI